MQAVESQSLILYQTHLQGQWPEDGARTLAVRLPYLKRLALGGGGEAARASLAGIALALHALAEVLGRRVDVGEIVFAHGEKPRLLQPARLAVGSTAAVARAATVSGPPLSGLAGIPADFSISHSGPWVACAAISGARVGLDLEVGTGAQLRQWVVREALLKATGVGLRAASETRAIGVPETALPEACVRWRGESWYARRLDLVSGATACVLTSCPVDHVVAGSVPLAELFAI